MSKDYSHQVYFCHNCGVKCHMGQYWVTDDDVVLCDNCFDDCTSKCEECGTILYDSIEEPSKDIYISVDNRLLCKGCFIKVRKHMVLKEM